MEFKSGFTASWFTSKYGVALTTGGIAATVAFFQALFINRPGAARMQGIGQAIAMRGGPPKPEEQAMLLSIRTKIFLSTKFIAAEVIISVIAMAIARYI